MSDRTEVVIEGAEIAKPTKRGRKSEAERVAEVSDVDLYKAEQKRIEHLAEIDAKYGDDMPYNQIRAENEVRFYLQQGAQAYLEAGRRLVLLKEHEIHGHWVESLNRIGLGEDTARKMMYTVEKLNGTSFSKAETFPLLAPSKLYEIALLEQPDLEELDRTGKVGAVSKDDIDRMSVRELKEALRKERDARKRVEATTDKMIQVKNQKLDELERQISLRPEPSDDEKRAQLLEGMATNFITDCARIVSVLRFLRAKLTDMARLPGVTQDQLDVVMTQMVELGTSGIAADWEALTTALSEWSPQGEGV